MQGTISLGQMYERFMQHGDVGEMLCQMFDLANIQYVVLATLGLHVVIRTPGSTRREHRYE